MTPLLACAFILAAAPMQGEIPVTTASREAAQLLVEGRRHLLNLDEARGQQILRQAVAADSTFPLALAWLGRGLGGSEGLALAQRASALAAKLPAAERMEIDALFAERGGEGDRGRRLKRELAELAPGDWAAQVMAGIQAQHDRKSQAAILYLRRAMQLAPDQPAPYNHLAYTYLGQGLVDEAVGVVRKLVELRPRDANARDSLGEVLLRAGKLDEADRAFEEATQISPDSWMAWVGRAYVRFFRGERGAAREMLGRGKAAVRSPVGSRMIDVVLAWSDVAAGASSAALRTMDELEKTSRARKDDASFAWAALERGQILVEMGKHDEARAQLAEAVLRSDKLPGEEADALRRVAFWAGQRAAIASGHNDAAAKALRGLEELAGRAGESPAMRDLLLAGRAAQAMATGNPAQAAGILAGCSRTSFRCQWELLEAQTLVGDKTGADETRAWLANANVRDRLHQAEDPTYLYLRARFGAPKPVASR
jgi:tetratricopeptide (TPR) repeat protein